MSTNKTFQGDIAIQDLRLPVYRRAIYEQLVRQVEGRVSVLTGTDDNQTGMVTAHEITGADYTPVPTRRILKGPAMVLWQEGVTAWLRERCPDVFIASGNVRILSTRRARRWARRSGVPVLGWGLGTMMIAQGLEWLRAPLRNAFYRGFDGIVAYSTRARDQYIEAGVPADRVFVVHNCIAPRPATPPPSRPDGFGDRPRLIFVGRVYPGKRVDLIIDALARFDVAERPTLEVVGSGPAVEALETQAQERLDPGDVVFSGSLFGDALRDAFDRADLFVMPGLGGLAVQEAMARGLPVVVGESDGTQDDLVRPDNGWILSSPDVDALEGILRDAVADPRRLRSMGEESYRIARDELNLEKMIEELVDACSRIVSLTRGGG